MRVAKGTDPVQAGVALRDRVTIDLRGIKPQLQAQAARRQIQRLSACRSLLLEFACDYAEAGARNRIFLANSSRVANTAKLQMALM